MPKTSCLLMSLLATMAVGPTPASGRNQPTSTENQAAARRTQPPDSTKDVLATVNGTPIGDADIRFALSNSGHNKEVPPEYRNNILEVIIGRELIYQRAVKLGLDANPRYKEKLRRMEARINAFKRKELSELFWRKIAEKVVVSEVEAKKYFAQNATRIQTELHVWQILRRKEKLIYQALDALEKKTPYEEVVRRQFPKLPTAGGEPWDLGYLRWNQVPKAWLNVVYDLNKGEVSGVIRGPNNRFWIIKLIDKRQNPDITFESIKPTMMEALRTAKIEEHRKQTDLDLRTKASIAYLKGTIDASDE